jgi:hypothetical protein
MRKPLITAVLAASTFAFSAQFAMADVRSNIEADIEVNSSGDIEATAKNIGSQGSIVEADAHVVGVEIDASERTDIRSDIELNVEVRHRGDIEATATNIGSKNSEVEATAGVVSIDIDSGGH